MKRLAGNEQGGAVSDTYEQKKNDTGKGVGKGIGKKSRAKPPGMRPLPPRGGIVRVVRLCARGYRVYSGGSMHLHKHPRYPAGCVLGAPPPQLRPLFTDASNS